MCYIWAGRGITIGSSAERPVVTEGGIIGLQAYQPLTPQQARRDGLEHKRGHRGEEGLTTVQAPCEVHAGRSARRLKTRARGPLQGWSYTTVAEGSRTCNQVATRLHAALRFLAGG